ncbi:MAG: macro domain-containing protein, partial [Ruminiclostridium sp.]|nr:macro domain-containing protein [Ruminiclostridium sp.]
VIHTPGPIWRGGDRNEPALLASCYRSCLALAREHGCKTVCFPSISTGVYHFPLNQAAEIAISTIVEVLKETDTPETVTMVCFDPKTKEAYEAALAAIL